MESVAKDLNSLSMNELTGVIGDYPWFGAARKELCVRMASTGGWGKEQFSDAAMYVADRTVISDLLRTTPRKELPASEVSKLIQEPKPVRKAGGDFFSQEEYKSVQREEDDYFSKFRVTREAPAAERGWEDPELGFCTETLAGIYAEQGYFVEAKKIYSRLILRYPEKSAYFASLIEKLEEKN